MKPKFGLRFTWDWHCTLGRWLLVDSHTDCSAAGWGWTVMNEHFVTCVQGTHVTPIDFFGHRAQKCEWAKNMSRSPKTHDETFNSLPNISNVQKKHERSHVKKRLLPFKKPAAKRAQRHLCVCAALCVCVCVWSVTGGTVKKPEPCVCVVGGQRGRQGSKRRKQTNFLY